VTVRRAAAGGDHRVARFNPSAEEEDRQDDDQAKGGEKHDKSDFHGRHRASTVRRCISSLVTDQATAAASSHCSPRTGIGDIPESSGDVALVVIASKLTSPFVGTEPGRPDCAACT
jgi:hypothetical protein